MGFPLHDRRRGAEDGLGALDAISLAEARKRAAEARQKVHDKIDPVEDRNAQRARRRLAAAPAMTFKQCADKYIDAKRQSWTNVHHADQWFATFNETQRNGVQFAAATAALNGLPVGAIDLDLVLQVLEPIWSRTPESARRIRGRIEAVLDWARVHGYRSGENPARWRGHLDKILAPRSKVKSVKHHEAAAYVDMPAFMGALRAREGVSARALEFAILTAARTKEVIGARWSEIDLDEGVWKIPGERMKVGREHRVPLSERALAILAALPREGEIIFPAPRSGGLLSNVAMLEVVRDMSGKGATVHGFRSTFRDWAAETTSYPNELLEIALAHTLGDKVEAAYRRGDQKEKRRRLMGDWSSYCERPPSSASNVVALRGR